MKRRERNKGPARAEAVQIRESGRHPFGVLDRYVPLGAGELQLYRAIREAVPILDAAIWKLIRLAGGARSTELLKRFNELRDLTERLMEDMAALEEQIAAIEARRADIDSMGDLA